jgi:hypothetical protein
MPTGDEYYQWQPLPDPAKANYSKAAASLELFVKPAQTISTVIASF